MHATPSALCSDQRWAWCAEIQSLRGGKRGGVGGRQAGSTVACTLTKPKI